MIIRFSLYSVFKNLRFFEKFFIIFMMVPAASGGMGLTFFQIGLFTGYQKLVTALLEVPSGFIADRWGRRRSLVLCFVSYVVAFPLFAMVGGGEPGSDPLSLGILAGALTAFGIGEAFRTGTHKAIMLDWVDQVHPPGGATRVVAVTRFWSKASAGVSAFVGGLLIWKTGSFDALFLAAILPAALGVVLILGYPSWLEGELTRERTVGPEKRPGLKKQFAAIWAVPGIGLLFWQSVLFESQFKLSQHYLQPFLQVGLETRDVLVVGGIGALLIGVYYLIQEGVGGLASAAAIRTETRMGNGPRVLTMIHLAAGMSLVLIALGIARFEWVVGILGFLAITVLQNLRRPMFVSQFNRVMDKPQRAITLSMESQARSLGFVILAPITGWVADSYGLPLTFGLLACLTLLMLGRDYGVKTIFRA